MDWIEIQCRWKNNHGDHERQRPSSDRCLLWSTDVVLHGQLIVIEATIERDYLFANAGLYECEKSAYRSFV